MSNKKAPINSAANESPMAILGMAMAMGSERAILRQESEGQKSFVGSDTLPTSMQGDWGPIVSTKVILERFGVKFLGPVEGDSQFQYVELPAGWKKVATDHSMWSNLVDDKGRKRAGIFYKAASYDRHAHLSLNVRFCVRRDYSNDTAAVAFVSDCDKTIFKTSPIPYNLSEAGGAYSKGNLDRADEAQSAADRWLNEKYPDHRNPAAYWEVEG